MKFLAAALFLIGYGFSAALAQTFDIVGVDSSDTLNMRADIDRVDRFSDGRVVGEIPANATNLRSTGLWVLLNGTKWREVTYGGTTGWVSSKFLRQAGGLDMPETLRCSGTEPFWGLRIRGDKGDLNDPELPQPQNLTLIGKRKGLNRTNVWAYYLATEDKTSVLTGLVVYTDQCSDGMSDLNYGYEIYLMGFRPGEGPAQGCCTVGG